MSDVIGKGSIIDVNGVNSDIKEINELLKGLKISIKEVIDSSKKLGSSLGGTTYNEAVSGAVRYGETRKNLTAVEKEHARILALAEKERIKLQNQLQQAQAKLSLAKSKENKQLIETRERTKALNREYAEAAKKKYNLTNKSNGLVTAFKNLAKSAVGYMLAFVGVQRVMQFFTRDLLQMNKKLDAQHFAMTTTIKDSIELKTTQANLVSMAKNYGQDILVLTERYIKFRAAAIQSNVSASQTMKIFDSTAKAAGVLGLKADELNGVFLALEQMLSKGKVTTEELRRQLGERMPGAMGIMADAVGVTIDELDKMMKKGELLSSYALPKFAEQIEIAYGIQSVTKINTLVAAHERLKTSWIEFVESLNSSKVYITTLNALNDIIDKITTSVAGAQKLGIKYGAELIAQIQKEGEAIEDLTKRREFYKQKMAELETILGGTEEALKKANKQQESFWSTIEKGMEAGIPGYGAILDVTNALGLTYTPLHAATENLEEARKISIGLTEAMADLDKIINKLGQAKDPLLDFEFVKMESAINGAEEAYDKLEKIGYDSMSDYTKGMVEAYNKEGKNHKDYLKNKLDAVEKALASAKEQDEREQKIYEDSGIQTKLTAQTELVKQLQKEYKDLENQRLNQSSSEKAATKQEFDQKKEMLSVEEETWNTLSQQSKEMNLRREEAQRIYAKWGELHEQIQMALYDEPEKGGRQTKAEELNDNRLALLKLKNTEDVIKFQMMQKNEWLKFVEKTNADEKLLESEKNNKIAAFEAEQAVKLIVVRQELNKKIIDLINVISNEEIEAAKGDAVKIENIKRATAVTLNEIANEQLDFTKEMNNEATDEQIRQAESDKKIAQEKAKILSDITLKENDRLAQEAILASKETALAQINVRKLNNRKIEALQRELAENELENLILASKKAIESSNLTYEAKEEEEKRLLELQSRYKDLLIEHSKEANDDQTAELTDWLNAVSEIYNALFDFINNLYEKQLQAAKKAYEMESTYAGASVEAKIMAEKKYEKKQVEIKKKQANAQKLQSGLNVLMTMLELTPKALAGDPMAIAGLIAGGISLAAIAAEPIPAYVEGGQHKGGTAKVSEEGQELFIDKKKRAFLTPKEETISYFPAGEFIPHDETQRLLAKYAMNQQAEILDMTGTNGYLRNIERNTRKKGETNYISDYKIIYRNGIKSKIRV